MCHVLYKPNVIVFPKLARQNFTSQAKFCKSKLLPWQSGEVWSRAKSDSRIPHAYNVSRQGRQMGENKRISHC
jgi:hypothetical protein